MRRIHADFPGGNLRLLEQSPQLVHFQSDWRDSPEGWFYFCFCVEGAQGTTVTFRNAHRRVGYWGPAVSHDRVHWHWLGQGTDEYTFTYTFGPQEDRVYFAHHILYPMERFHALARRHGVEPATLCQSGRGRPVPCLQVGTGSKHLVLTARHHACESTGSFVLEGVLDHLLAHPFPDTQLFCVPFVDLDGVLDGDQGKGRAPHDHNRDYTAQPLYASVAAIQRYVAQNGITFGVDFHSPWHTGGENDRVFVVRNCPEKRARFDAFSQTLRACITPDSLAYDPADDTVPGFAWNQPSPNFGFVMNARPECHLAFSLETAYFGTAQALVTVPSMLALGQSFARALTKYWKEQSL